MTLAKESEQMDLLNIEKELQSVIEEDKKSWIKVYQLMTVVEADKLYADLKELHLQMEILKAA